MYTTRHISVSKYVSYIQVYIFKYNKKYILYERIFIAQCPIFTRSKWLLRVSIRGKRWWPTFMKRKKSPRIDAVQFDVTNITLFCSNGIVRQFSPEVY